MPLMASLSFPCPVPLTRVHSNLWPIVCGPHLIQFQDSRIPSLFARAVSKRNISPVDFENVSNEEHKENASKNLQRAPRRSRKKVTAENPEENSSTMGHSDKDEKIRDDEEDKSIPLASAEAVKKSARKGRRKATPSSSSDNENIEKKVSRRGRKKAEKVEESQIVELCTPEEHTASNSLDGEREDILVGENDGEDISHTYSWPPLVCCFGAAQHAFIPSGRPANRLIDYEIHEAKKDMFWSPTKFVRAPGGSSSSVAVALASIGGRVAFMGKLGDDEYGQSLLYHLNVNNVQTRSVTLDSSKATAVSYMKIPKRSGLKLSCVRPCAEDSLLSSEISTDVLKEAKMFYFNSSSLLDPNMRSTTMQVVEASKKLGGVIFFDLNLPFPLWHSGGETKAFLQEAWESADVIEVTKQELEFLCGIEPSENFDTNDNDKSKFLHHKPEVVMQLWHENLKVLFVTNGTSKIHYYTERDNGWIHGMEDAPITPFTGDMSASGDAIVAALMRMLTVQPHLITDKGYLEHMIRYAIDCGVIDQWLLARIHGFPPKEGIAISSPEFGRQMSITEREYRTAESVS